MNDQNDFRSIFYNANNNTDVPTTPEVPSEPSVPYTPEPVMPSTPVLPTDSIKNDNDVEMPKVAQPGLTSIQDDVIRRFNEQPVQQPVQQPEYVEPTEEKKTFNKKIIYIVVGVLVALLFIFALLGGPKGFKKITNKHTNQTGGNYTGTDVTYNCTYTKDEDDNHMIAYTDVLFNYKNYQAQIFSKLVLTKPGLTDEKYEKFIKNLYGLCVVDNKCSANELDAGITSYGVDTHIKREGDKVTITYSNVAGLGMTASDKDKADVKEKLESQGMSCK